MASEGAHPGILHHYSHRLVSFEHQPDPSNQAAQNTLIFVGGLNDGLLTVPFIPPLAKALPPNWSLAETLISSSYTGFGSSTLGQDVEEIAQCVSYFRNRRPGGRVVLMGHSTGSQDVMHYLISPGERPRIDGGIMQSGVSDREGFNMFITPALLNESVRVAQQYVRERRENDVLPGYLTNTILTASISAKRWLSLVSPGPEHAGEDDYFSSDFDDERLRRTFGKLGLTKTPICILYGAKDSFVPEGVNKMELVAKWERHIREGGGVVGEGSGVVPEMSHTVKELRAPLDDMIKRIHKFLSRIEDDSTQEGSKQSTIQYGP